MAGQTDDRDDIFDDGPEDDDTAAVIRKALDEQGFNDAGEDDDAGLDSDMEIPDEEKLETVSQEEATALASDAQVKGEKAGRKKAKAAETTEGDEGAEVEGTEDGDKPEAKETEKAEDDPKPEPEDLTALSTDDLMKGVPHKSRAEITRRLDAATKALAPFKSPYIQSQMQRFGADEVAVATRLADLARYASEKPDEYIAWVASEMAGAPDKIADVLNAAAERHGLKVVAASASEDDPFEDEEVARLRRENEALKRQSAPRDFGPDTPERQRARQVEQDLNNWMYERDQTGNLKRPHFQMLQPQIQQLAAVHVQQTRQPVTVADLDRFYQMAEAQVRGAFGQPQPAPQPSQPAAPQPTNLAARESQPVDDGLQQRHEAAQRAQRAAKSIDGTGQSATRRPALDADADLSDVIRAQLQRYSA